MMPFRYYNMITLFQNNTRVETLTPSVRLRDRQVNKRKTKKYFEKQRTNEFSNLLGYWLTRMNSWLRMNCYLALFFLLFGVTSQMTEDR